MSITDELRRFAANWDGWFYSDKGGGLIHAIGHDPIQSTPVPKVINAIANRIDEQAEKESEAAWRRGYERGEDEAKFENLDELRKEVQADWIPLPVDADGKVIHVEDEVELLDGSKRFKAEWLEWDGEDWVVHETIGYGAYHEPSSLRHVQPDSWERIIKDAQEYVTDDEPLYSVFELVERCRRLAGAE